MCCPAEKVIDQLADAVAGLKSAQQPCCQVEPPVPYATCCMVTPPPILAPTQPQPVKPLQLPCPFKQGSPSEQISEDEQLAKRYANFYNNYNLDYHINVKSAPVKPVRRIKRIGCEDYSLNKRDPHANGCPTGFKPCQMKLFPPPQNHPCGVWCAQVQPCPPKPKIKLLHDGRPEVCTRPCCKHWKPKEGPCLYNGICKAHCYNHPIGIKP